MSISNRWSSKFRESWQNLKNARGPNARREAEYLDAVSTLFETQDRLSRQLEILLRRVASLNADHSSGREPGRAIAEACQLLARSTCAADCRGVNPIAAL